MPRRQASSEYFKFAIDDWKFEYSFRVNVKARAGDPLGACSEGPGITIEGPLLSKTKRRCQRVEVNLRSSPTLDTINWKREWKGLGSTMGIGRGTLTGYALVPTASFQCLVTALAAGKVPGAYLVVDEMERGRGIITTFFTLNPNEDKDDDEK